MGPGVDAAVPIWLVMDDLTQAQQRTEELKNLLIQHLRTHSVQTGEFTLKSGKKSPWFLDAKQTACDPEGIRLVAELAMQIIPADVTAVGGLTVGSDPVAYGIAALSSQFGHPLRSFTVRKEAKGHGMGGRIAGALRPGDRVVIVEDAVTRGVSPMEAAEVVNGFGAEVVLIMPLVDRGGTCETLAAAAGIPYRALVTAPDLGFPFEKDV